MSTEARTICGKTEQARRAGGSVEVYVCWREPNHEDSHHGPLMGRAPGPDEAFMTWAPAQAERSAGAAPLDAEVLAQALHTARLRYPGGTYYCGSESGPFEFDSASCSCAMDMREVIAEHVRLTRLTEQVDADPR